MDERSSSGARKEIPYEPLLVAIVAILALVVGIAGLVLSLLPKISHFAHLFGH